MNQINELSLDGTLIEMTGEKADYLNKISGSFFTATSHVLTEAESNDPALYKRGYVNKCYYNVSLDIKLGAEQLANGKTIKPGTLFKFPGTSTKKRYLIPGLFYGISGKAPKSENDTKVLPAIIGFLAGALNFVGFLKLVFTVIKNAWEEISKIIDESKSGDDDPLAKSFKGDKFLEGKKDEINGQDPAKELDPKTPPDLVQVDPPVGGLVTLNGNEEYVLRDKSGKKGFSVYIQTIDNKWFFVTGSGWEKNLVVLHPGAAGIRLPDNAVNGYVTYNKSDDPKKDTGNVWGRFYLYEEA